MTRAGGFNGIAATTWGGAFRMRMSDRYSDGVPSGGMSLNLKNIALQATCIVVRCSGRRSYTGRTTRDGFECATMIATGNSLLHSLFIRYGTQWHRQGI